MRRRAECTNTPAAYYASRNHSSLREAGAIVLVHNASIMSFRLDNAMSGGSLFVFLLPESASPRAPEKLPALLLSSPAFPFAFPSTPFPASSPSLPSSLAHSKQMSRYDSRCELEATTTAYDIPPTVTTVSTFARCHVKSSRLALKTLHVPCFRVYPNERGTSEDIRCY